MKQYTKWFCLIACTLIIKNSHSAEIENPEVLIPVLDLVLNADSATSVPYFPRRRDFGDDGVFSAVNGNLISRSLGGRQLTYDYDELDRVTGVTFIDSDDPTANFSLVFNYISLTTESLSAIELTSYSDFGTELSSQINFMYTSLNQLNSFTNATFEGAIGSNIEEEQIFTISVNYEPVYENNLLVMIHKEFINDLPFPLGGTGGSTIDISYDKNTVTEIEEIDPEGGGRSVGRRINLSDLQQEVVRQLVTSEGFVFFDDSEVANYERVSCNDSNRLVEENFLILNLFIMPSLNAFFEPELCRD